jgi:hypothetical protein
VHQPYAEAFSPIVNRLVDDSQGVPLPRFVRGMLEESVTRALRTRAEASANQSRLNSLADEVADLKRLLQSPGH